MTTTEHDAVATGAYAAALDVIAANVDTTRPLGSAAEHLEQFAAVLREVAGTAPSMAGHLEGSASMLSIIVTPLLRRLATAVGEEVTR